VESRVFPKYSVLMGVYAKDDPEYFSEAINSMLNQTVPSDDILIVVDGPLGNELSRTVMHFEENFPEVRIHRLPDNVGIGRAFATALPHCRHNLVARMDADDISVPDRMKRQLSYIENHPNVSILSSDVAEFVGNTTNVVAVKRVPTTDRAIRSLARRWNPINHPAVLFRKDHVLLSGNYQDFPRYEDYHLWVRMLMAGYQAANIPEPLLYYRLSIKNLERRRKGTARKSAIDFHLWKQRVGFAQWPDTLWMIGLMTIISVTPGPVFRMIYKLKRRRPGLSGLTSVSLSHMECRR